MDTPKFFNKAKKKEMVTIDQSIFRLNDKELREVLLKGGYVSEEDLKRAELEKTTNIVEWLLRQELLTKDLLGQALAEYFKLPYADLNSYQPPAEQVLKIPEETAKQYRLVLFKEAKKTAVVTTDVPAKAELKPVLATLFPGLKVTLNYSLREDIDVALLNYQQPLSTRFSDIIAEGKRVAPEILDEIFADAYNFHASDIHFEPQSEEVVVRFRVDGVLQEAGRLPSQHYENILNRIKIQSSIRIDEHFAAQDGSMQYDSENIRFDVRTSIVPTITGEKVVLRLLAAYVQGFALSDLGLSTEHQTILEGAAKKPFGMILVTGPTGSGKSTTLYATLKLLQNPEINITTIEDPVEYKMSGANQIQVRKETGLTFAKGLRSIVRQDPDIILVGEIRDEETAEIAVNAALTGHLLLSTFHANDAATAIPRLLDMNIEPFLLASTLEVVVAERLVRKICDHCRHSVTVSKAELDALQPGLKKHFPGRKLTFYQGKGCSMCQHTGYKGRTGIFEFIQVTPELQELILSEPSAQEIRKLASKQGAKILFADGIEKVKAGVTTIEELLRVAPPPRA